MSVLDGLTLISLSLVPADEESSSVEPPNNDKKCSEAVVTTTTAGDKEIRNESHDGKDDSGMQMPLL